MKWSETEITLLREMYPHYSLDYISNELDRSIGSVHNKAKDLRLKKSPQYKEWLKYTSAYNLNTYGEPYRFKKGQPAHNKGKKMSESTKKKIEHTFFKKGSKPYHAVENGHEHVNKEGYVVVRIAPSKTRLKHHIIWEQHHGTIPSGKIITFRDGNKKNFDIHNLEMITRQEGMNRNTIHNYPRPIKDSLYAIASLTRTINKIQNAKK
jgi:hypothetical protein